MEYDLFFGASIISQNFQVLKLTFNAKATVEIHAGKNRIMQNNAEDSSSLNAQLKIL